MNYPCTVFGDLRIPYFEFHNDVERPYSSEEVICRPFILKDATEDAFEIPDSTVKGSKDKLAETKRKEAENQRKVFFDGPMVQLKSYSVNDELHKLNMDLGRTSFFTYAATNKSVDNEEVKRMVNEVSKSIYQINNSSYRRVK